MMDGLKRSARWVGLSMLLAGVPLAQAQSALPVVVAEVEVRQAADRIEALGTLRANETAHLAATVTETITAIRFQDGQRVVAGDVLVELNQQEQQALLDEALAMADNAQRQLERSRKLLDNRHISQADLDMRSREYDAAQARVRALEARLAERQIVAPFDSVVGLRNLSVGSLVTPGTVVVTLHDDSIMKLDFSVPETLLGRLRPQLPLNATTAAYPGQAFSGNVSVIDNQVDPVTRSVQVRALIPNPGRILKPGMLMKVEIATAARQSLVIPEEALLPVAREVFVMVVRETAEGLVAERRQVHVGARRPGEVEVTQGLNPGQQVVVRGNHRLTDGQAIRIQ